MSESRWIQFVEIPVPPHFKTRRWHVRARENSVLLGVIQWFGRWRQYAFFPAGETVFERQCLRDLAEFCERETKAQRAARRGAQTKL